MSSKTKTFIALCAASLLPASSFAFRTEGSPQLPVYEEAKYMRDYFAPQPDWVPEWPVLLYTQNTRTPQIVWVKYKGAYAPGIRIRPIEKKWLEKEQEFKLLRFHGKRLEFQEASEKFAYNRTIVVNEIDEEADFTALTFKVKADVKNTDAELVITAKGLNQVFKTAECKDVKTEADGVKVYTFPMTPNAKLRLKGLAVTVSPIKGKLEDAKQEITIFDFHFKRAKPHAFVKSIAPRGFIKKDTGEKITDIYEYLASAPAADSKALPVKGWTPGDPEKDTGVKVSAVKEKVNGVEMDALRIEWASASRDRQKVARVKIPFANNALEFNTFSFLYKMEVPEGLPVCEGLELSRIPQYFYFDKYLDNPGISFASDYDRYNWNKDHGVTRSHVSQGKRTSAKVPKGWKFFAFDMVHDDPTGNKGFTLDKITSYEITLKNSLIPAGKKVVMTVILPKVTRGLMYSGGDMALYKEFMQWKKNYKPLTYKEALKQQPFAGGKLAEPLEAMKNRMITFEIVSGGWNTANRDARTFSARLLANYIERALNPLNDVPVLNAPSKKDNVKIFLGIPPNLKPELAEAVKAKREAVKDSPGYFIFADGKNIYIGGGEFGILREDKGIMNGVLDFLEYNLGILFPRASVKTGKFPEQDQIEAILPKKRYTDYSFTWGNRVHKPEMKYWGFSHGTERYSYLNRASYHGCWYSQDGIDFSSYRSYAANHWFGFGALLPDRKDDRYWGRRKDGKTYMPATSTGSPCLVRVIDAGKDDFLNTKFVTVNGKPAAQVPDSLYRFNDHSVPVWIEDSWNSCQCSECQSPFRLPDGTLITNTDPDFQTEWHIVNAMAYNQMVRVYANRNSELNYLIYFFTIPVPRTPLTKYVRAHFCPYVRVDYDQPIYAPVNDKFWRIITQWGKIARTVGVSDYFLGGNFRPSADVQSADLQAMNAAGVQWFGQETESKDASFTEMWVSNRMIWEPRWNPDALRAYYCSKVYGAGGEDVYNFYAKLRSMRYREHRDVDFEDWAEMGFLALKTPASKSGVFGKKYASLAEELTADLERAAEKTENDPVAKFFVEKVKTAWSEYLEKAKAPLK